MDKRSFIYDVLAGALSHYDFVKDDLNQQERDLIEKISTQTDFFENLLKDEDLTNEAFLLAEKIHNMN